MPSRPRSTASDGEPPSAKMQALSAPGVAVPQMQLANGACMPALGLGVYRVNPGAETEKSVRQALEIGYRMVDTAALYRNEESVGKALRESGVPRKDVFLTTKLWDDDHGYEKALRAARRSIQKLSVDYVDLYLMHSPNRGKIVETWDALLEIQRLGLARHVGVSNFGVEHLEALERHGRPMPAVNQIEMHPLVYRARLPIVNYCKDHGVLVQAYGSLCSGRQRWLEAPQVQAVASSVGRTPAQVLLRWGHQLGFQLIPKSTHWERLEENYRIFDFELGEAEMASLSRMRGDLHEYWDPTSTKVHVGETCHWSP